MAQPVVHFEVIGSDPAALRRYYAGLFGWEFETGGPVAPSVSDAGNYGFTEAGRAGSAGDAAERDSAEGGAAEGRGIPGGVGGGQGHRPHVVFYVEVPDVAAALRRAESLGGRRAMGPERSPGTGLVVAHFTDPEGNLVGLAGTT